ncbi:S-adenosyl-L-methionine-dependent methyltransferases superfamily protein [Tanacetum coccineum]
MIIAVYAPHDPRDKRMLWDYLAHVINQWQGEVVIMGDFNEVRVKSDRFGTNFNVLGANIFNSFINSTGLEEVHLGGEGTEVEAEKRMEELAVLVTLIIFIPWIWLKGQINGVFDVGVWNELPNDVKQELLSPLSGLDSLKPSERSAYIDMGFGGLCSGHPSGCKLGCLVLKCPLSTILGTRVGCSMTRFVHAWEEIVEKDGIGIWRVGYISVASARRRIDEICPLPNIGATRWMETSATREYPSLIHTFFLTHTVGGVFLNPEDKALYDEMLRLQGLGSNTPTGVPYTEDEIMAIVRGGKQRGHIPGVGRVLPGQGTVIPPPSQSTHSTDIARLKKREKQLTKQVNMFMRLFRSDDKFSQMLNQFESQPEYGGGSGSGGCGDDEPGDDEDGGEDEDDS